MRPGTGHPMGAWSLGTMGRVTTGCHAPLVTGHNMSHNDNVSVNMTRGAGMTQVAMFPHVPDRSLGFSFGEVLHPSARYC